MNVRFLELTPDLLAINRGTVTAPAGCGKTHLIAETLKRHDAAKPILILTHTNAGVAALRGRLDKAGVPPRAYRLATIDGWAIRLIGMFPARSEHNPDILKLEHPGSDYPAIRKAAAKLLKAGHVLDVIAASYSRLIVDEYQDCSILQHAIVYYVAPATPLCVLGDPMQAIFGWKGNELADWDQHVCTHFPLAGELTTPWRWRNANTEAFGRWLLDVRRALKEGASVDLRSAPPEVTWVDLDGTENRARQLRAASTRAPDRDGTVLIIGDARRPGTARQADDGYNGREREAAGPRAACLPSPEDIKKYGITDAQRSARQRALDAAHYDDGRWKRWQWYYIGDRDPSNKEFDFVIHNAHMEDYRTDMPNNDVDNYDYPWPKQTNEFTGKPTYQTSAIPILDSDAICADGLKGIPNYGQDSYQEMLGLTSDRPYLIYCGVNTNWCILRRHNGMRTMARAGKSLWIVRDLTDAALGRSTTGLTDYATQWDGTGNLYKHAFKPGGPQAYDHFDGTDLVVDWIGRTLGAATWTSAQVTGRPRLVFPGDSPSRVWPRVA